MSSSFSAMSNALDHSNILERTDTEPVVDVDAPVPVSNVAFVLGPVVKLEHDAPLARAAPAAVASLIATPAGVAVLAAAPIAPLAGAALADVAPLAVAPLAGAALADVAPLAVAPLAVAPLAAAPLAVAPLAAAPVAVAVATVSPGKSMSIIDQVERCLQFRIEGEGADQERPLIKGKSPMFGHVLMTANNTAYEYTWLSMRDEVIISSINSKDSYVNCRTACFGEALSIYHEKLGWICLRVGDTLQPVDLQSNKLQADSFVMCVGTCEKGVFFSVGDGKTVRALLTLGSVRQGLNFTGRVVPADLQIQMRKLTADHANQRLNFRGVAIQPRGQPDPQVDTPDEGSNLAPSSAKDQRAADQVTKKLENKIAKLQVRIETQDKEIAKYAKAEQQQRQKMMANDLKANALLLKLAEKDKEIAAKDKDLVTKEKRIDRLEGLVLHAAGHAPPPTPVTASAPAPPRRVAKVQRRKVREVEMEVEPSDMEDMDDDELDSMEPVKVKSKSRARAKASPKRSRSISRERSRRSERSSSSSSSEEGQAKKRRSSSVSKSSRSKR